MGHNQEKTGQQARAIADELARQHGLFATPAEFAQGVVYHLAADAPGQARAIAYCWWGLDVEVMRNLVEAKRWDTLAALFRPPSPAPRKQDRHYAAAAREFGITPKAVRDAVARGLRALLAWQLVQQQRKANLDKVL